MFLELDGIECDEKDILIESFNLWEKENIDFVDSYIMSLYIGSNINDIYSYDKHMKNKDINCFKPNFAE